MIWDNKGFYKISDINSLTTDSEVTLYENLLNIFHIKY